MAKRENKGLLKANECFLCVQLTTSGNMATTAKKKNFAQHRKTTVSMAKNNRPSNRKKTSSL